MIAIEHVESPKRGVRVVTLEDGSAFTFFACGETEFSFSKGRLADAQAMAELEMKNQKCAAQKVSLDLLAMKARTEKQLSDALHRRGFKPEAIESALAYHKAHGYLNDEDYAQYFVDVRKSATGLSRRALEAKLRQRGIGHEESTMALEAFSPEEETEGALRFAKQASGRYRDLPARERKAKLSQSLARKGYDWEIIHTVLRKLEQNTEDEFE